MPWSAGNYTKGNAGSGGWTGDASLGIGIEAGRHDTQDNDFATGIDACINKDGSNAFSGNVNFGNNRPVNINLGDAATPGICLGGDANTGIFGPAADTWAVATNGTERVRINSTGQIVGQLAGSAAAPAICLGNDTNTGLYSASADTVSIATNGTERVTVNSTGNFLIKNAYVEETAANPVFNLENTSTTTNDGGVLRFGHNQTSSKPLAEIRALLVDGNVGTRAGHLALYTSSQTTGNITERMRITQAGNVLVGLTNALSANNKACFQGTITTGGEGVIAVYNDSGSGDSSPGITISKATTTTTSAQRFMQFYVGGVTTTAMGGIVGNGASNVQFATISDIREKTNIEPITGCLNNIVGLNPVQFDWITNGEHCNAGFIAQEVELIFPEFVVENMASEGEEPRKGLTGGMTSGIIAHVIGAMKELNAKVEALKARVAELEA